MAAYSVSALERRAFAGCYSSSLETFHASPTKPAQVLVPALDWRVTAFTIGVSLLTGLLFGLFPALHTSKPDLVSTLKESSGRSGTSLRHTRVRSALVVAEMALALVLLVGAALLIRSFVGLRSVDPGFDPHNVFTFQTSLAGGAYSTTARVSDFTTQVVRRVETLPGVEAAASTIVLPVEAGVDLPFTIVGKPPAQGEYNGDEQWRSVSPQYFRVLKIPLLRGRAFTETDTGASARVVIVNDAMAKKYWPKEDALGQQIVIGKGPGAPIRGAVKTDCRHRRKRARKRVGERGRGRDVRAAEPDDGRPDDARKQRASALVVHSYGD